MSFMAGAAKNLKRLHLDESQRAMVPSSSWSSLRFCQQIRCRSA
jgi:hypothetical protein